MLFYNETLKRKLTLDEVAADIYAYIKEDDKHDYNIFTGADSQREKGKTCYVTIITVLREGCGGRNYILKEVVKEKITMRQRIWNEATSAVSCFSALIEELKKLGLDDTGIVVEYDQVHADVGYNGKSKELIGEITGFIEAYGFKAVIKPNAFVAQCIANKFTKKF